MIVIDNYFHCPKIIRNYALSNVKYYPKQPEDGWEGYRSYLLSEKNDLEKEIILKIENTLTNEVSKELKTLDVYFHCCPRFIMHEIYDFHEMKWHQDQCDYAGVIYMTPNPPKNTGTCFKPGDCVENVYNRFLCYPGKLTHGPDHLFGKDLKTTRMTITFFSWT